MLQTKWCYLENCFFQLQKGKEANPFRTLRGMNLENQPYKLKRSFTSLMRPRTPDCTQSYFSPVVAGVQYFLLRKKTRFLRTRLYNSCLFFSSFYMDNVKEPVFYSFSPQWSIWPIYSIIYTMYSCYELSVVKNAVFVFFRWLYKCRP